MAVNSKKTMTGLSIHSEHICLVEFENGKVQRLVSHDLARPFELDALRDGETFLEDQADSLRAAFQRMGGHCREVCVSLPLCSVLLKKVPLALGLGEEMIRDHIFWEADQFLISPRDNFILDYQRLPFQTQEGNPLYLLVLVRNDVIAAVQKMIKESGLHLKRIDVDVFSSIRSLNANYDMDPSAITLLVDVQREDITFIIIRQSDYFLSHRMILSQDKIAEGGLDATEIARYLIKELKRLVFGHRLGSSMKELGRLYMMGYPSVRSLADQLSETESLDVEVVNPFTRLEVGKGLSQSEAYIAYPERFSASVGATLA